MTQKELSSRFPESCRIGNQILLISPDDFYKLEGITIEGSRMFLMVCSGMLNMTLNNRPYEIGANSYFDIMETTTAHIDSIGQELRGWCLLVSFEFASESLKNLRPGPLHYSLEHPHIRIWHFTEAETARLERPLNLLHETLADATHYYRRELASVYFKSFSLELGNCMLTHQENDSDIPPYVSKRDFITLNFMTLVSKHFAEEHHIEFYANALCISTKHLTRVVKEMVGKPPPRRHLRRNYPPGHGPARRRPLADRPDCRDAPLLGPGGLLQIFQETKENLTHGLPPAEQDRARIVSGNLSAKKEGNDTHPKGKITTRTHRRLLVFSEKITTFV